MRNQIKDFMTPCPETVTIDTSIKRVISIFSKSIFDHLPVLDGNKKLTGMISKVDVYRKLLSLSTNSSGRKYSDKVLKSTLAKDVMTSPVVTVEATKSPLDAIETFLAGGFHAVPVMDNDELVGILSSKDLIDFLAEL